jgi:spore coat polysaccharide biosynthesis predicted glycosyltransferase SpsG
MSNKLTILFAPLDGYGHVNACTGVAEALRDRGHKIVFAIDKSWKGKLLNYGFEEELYCDPSREENEKAGEFWVNFFIKAEKVLPLPPIEHFKGFGTESTELFINQALDNDSKMKEIIDRIKPDVIVVDSYVTTPSILKSGIPWVLLVSANPLVGIQDERTPPCFSGKQFFY